MPSDEAGLQSRIQRPDAFVVLGTIILGSGLLADAPTAGTLGGILFGVGVLDHFWKSRREAIKPDIRDHGVLGSKYLLYVLWTGCTLSLLEVSP